MIEQHRLHTIRTQGEALGRLRAGQHRGKVHILASDVSILLDAALQHSRFANGGDDALRNYWITTRRECEARIDQTIKTQRARGEPVDARGVLHTLSMFDFAQLVDAAQQVAQAIEPKLNHGHGSGIAGDGARELQVEPMRGAGAIDERADGKLEIEGKAEQLAPDQVDGDQAVEAHRFFFDPPPPPTPREQSGP